MPQQLTKEEQAIGKKVKTISHQKDFLFIWFDDDNCSFIVYQSVNGNFELSTDTYKDLCRKAERHVYGRDLTAKEVETNGR